MTTQTPMTTQMTTQTTTQTKTKHSKSLCDAFKAAAAAVVLAAPLAFAAPAAAQDNAGPGTVAAGTTANDTAGATAGAGQGLAVGPVTFGAPWMLLGLGTLPLLWYLMRSVPPKPREEYFPAMRILFNLTAEEQEPARMPLWQRILRLAAAGAVITGLAQPELNPLEPLEGQGAVVAVIDNGWAAAANWDARRLALENLIDRAENENRQVILLPTAPAAEGGAMRAPTPVDAAKAREALKALAPQPWPVDRDAALAALEASGVAQDAHIVWFGDGVEDAGALRMAQRVLESGNGRLMQDAPDKMPHILLPAANGEKLAATVKRAGAGFAEVLNLTASDERGNPVATAEAAFGPGDTETQAVFDVPQEIRNQVARIAINGENGAGAVLLLDERWRRRPVGLVRLERGGDTAQPLLEEGNYVERALAPYVDLRQGSVDEILKNPPAVMVVTDAVPLSPAARAKITAWVEGGGTLLRFAGPRLTETHENDDLLPVRLRPGTRTLDRSLTGEKRGNLAPFEEGSPFHGLPVPQNVSVSEEVMAQPDGDLNGRTWARLQDGTPVVTAKDMGKGRVVLVHTTANPNWSNLPLSGLFVDMMRAVVTHSQGVGGANGLTQSLPPLRIMDGTGQLGAPSGDVRPLSPNILKKGTVSAQNPPGFYGDESARHAHNLFAGVPALAPLPRMPEIPRQSYESVRSRNDLSGPFLAGAFALLMADIMVLMAQQRLLPMQGGRRNPFAPKPR